MNRTFQSLLSALGVAVLIFTSGCGSIGQKSPSEVVIAAIHGCVTNENKYSEAEKYMSSEVINAMKGGLWALAGGWKGAWDEATRNGTIQKIEILKEEVRGEGAEVDFRIHFKDGKTKDDDEPLIKEDGKWKITIG